MTELEQNKRLEYLIKDVFKMSVLDFSSRYNDTKGVKTYNILRGRNGISNKMLDAIVSSYPEINRNWLLTGEGSMLQKDELGIKASEPCEMSSYITYRLPISALAGSLANFAHSVYKNQLEKIISPIKDVDYSMPVYGDSMQPDYPNGCEIYIKKVNENSFIRWGETYVLDTDNGVVIKNVFEGEDKNYVRCVSINEKYPEFQIKKTDIHGWYKVLIVLIPKQN